MQQTRIRLVAGLGNPGRTYSGTRHNVGFMVLDEVAKAFSIELLKRKFNTQFGTGSIDDVKVVLAKPMDFMNRSGPPVQQIAGYFRISTQDILVIHDDIDIEFGRLKIKEKGGDGGHKGVRSIMDAFGRGDFARLRIGVGRPDAEKDTADYVLDNFAFEEEKVLSQIIASAKDAVVAILCKGTKEGMNRFNNKKISISS